jgi:hypothetical protein
MIWYNYNTTTQRTRKMVKNTGGNKSKKQARKNVNASMTITQGVRRVLNPSEMYASVTKIYSAKRCDVLGSDGIVRPCNVRGKFLGRRGGSGENMLAIGSWIMIGFYDWEVRSDGSKSCDLLEIYTTIEREKLKQIETRTLLGAIINLAADGKDSDLTFSSFHTGDLVESKPVEEEDSGSSICMSSDDDEDEGDDDEAKQQKKKAAKQQKQKEKIAPVPATTNVTERKETIQDQMDWLSISERDI